LAGLVLPSAAVNPVLTMIVGLHIAAENIHHLLPRPFRDRQPSGPSFPLPSLRASSDRARRRSCTTAQDRATWRACRADFGRSSALWRLRHNTALAHSCAVRTAGYPQAASARAT